MTALREMFADVARKERRFREVIGVEPNYEDYQLADALLASPDVAAIIDLAAWFTADRKMETTTHGEPTLNPRRLPRSSRCWPIGGRPVPNRSPNDEPAAKATTLSSRSYGHRSMPRLWQGQVAVSRRRPRLRATLFAMSKGRTEADTMTTDQEHADVLRRFVVNQHTADDYVQDALERAIEVLDPKDTRLGLCSCADDRCSREHR